MADLQHDDREKTFQSICKAIQLAATPCAVCAVVWNEYVTALVVPITASVASLISVLRMR